MSISLDAFSQIGESPKVLDIYPSADAIPVNILRFYIQFSKPMQEMQILDHIKLSNEEGEDITGVFYKNQYELWNQDRTEVTLIIDPGRVKTGLLAHNTMGRAFEEGQHYVLTVDSLLLDFNDNALKRSYRKKFVAIAEDIKAPNVQYWNTTIPPKMTKDPLNIIFNDIIDHISAQTLIKVLHENKVLPGKIILSQDEQKWKFIPRKKWKKGAYQIIVNPRVEDIAANSMNQLFDHKIADFKKNNDANLFIKFIIE